MAGAIDHVIINCNDYQRAREFYGWLMPQLGFGQALSFDQPEPFTGYIGEQGKFWIRPSAERFQTDSFDRRRVGLCEVCFRGESRAQVDTLAKQIESHGGKILDPPREYPMYAAGYYAVFFTDADGMKLEIAHIPG